ncbi:MAG TPA: hypothetical protein VF895_08695 [Gaiellaceae bacterium]
MRGRLIETYLSELECELDVGRRAKRRILREIEAHLVEASAEMSEQAAVDNLGTPQLVARRFLEERAASWKLGRIAFGGLVVGVLAIGLALAIVAVTRSPRQPALLGDGHIKALDRNPANLHRVLSDGERTVWVSSGEPDSICYVISDRLGNGRGCTARSVLLKGPIYVTSQESSDLPISVVGLVDDAVLAVQGPGGETVSTRNNAFAFDGIPANSDSISLRLFTATGSRSFVIRMPDVSVLLRG